MINLKNSCYILLPARKQLLLLFILGVCSITVFMSGCVRTTKNKEVKTRVPQRKTYAKLRNYRLKLELLTARRRFYAGEDVKITYRLINLGKKSLRLNEWYMNEPDNLRLYYMPYKQQLTSFNPKKWILVDPDYKQPPSRFELVMRPKNSVLIDKQLPFVKAAGEDNPTVKRGRYYLIAELTLNSVDVRSKPVIISIP
ncbi:MAG: hypothetical protein L3J71_04230 [Victivallaceae bacterium]|nr:hypothetical protein [Victivallaceae bacterium]